MSNKDSHWEKTKSHMVITIALADTPSDSKTPINKMKIKNPPVYNP